MGYLVNDIAVITTEYYCSVMDRGPKEMSEYALSPSFWGPRQSLGYEGFHVDFPMIIYFVRASLTRWITSTINVLLVFLGCS